MRRLRLVLIKLLVVFIDQSLTITYCDRATTARVHEGNLGMTSDFNWLGVLKVHLHDGDKWQVAVSGIVLIKVKYALANADDVVRIPMRVFKEDSLAMFIPAPNKPWYVSPLSYVTHPEYEYSTFNSIAIIELNSEDAADFPLNPICFPTASFNASKYLYLTGYTDENRDLEKVIYKIQYLDKSVCEEFYNRAGLTDKNRMPTSYVCGYAPYNYTHCVWDNGMALVSNVTGYFLLVGFGIRGPGCAAPARFIDLTAYFKWIHTVTNPQEEMYDDDYRRKDDEIEFIPVHELFTENGSRRLTSGVAVTKSDFHNYPFDVDKLHNFAIKPTDDENTIAIYTFDEMLEQHVKACSSPRVKIYEEYFELRTAEGLRGVTHYKLTLFDKRYNVPTCVRLTIDCVDRSAAQLSFKEEMHYYEGTGLDLKGEDTPEEILRDFPILERTTKSIVETTFDPAKSKYLRPAILTDQLYSSKTLNYDLYVKFEFDERAIMRIEMYSAAFPPTESPDRRMMKPKKRKKQRKEFSYWGVSEPDKMFKEPGVSLVADEVMQATVSVGWSEVSEGLVVLTCLIIVRLGTAFFVG